MLEIATHTFHDIKVHVSQAVGPALFKFEAD